MRIRANRGWRAANGPGSLTIGHWSWIIDHLSSVIRHDEPERKHRGATRTGFTLIEVILAIAIATGILVVALVFYQQAAHLRSQVIEEAERLSAIRLVMERVTADLRSAFAQPQIGFTGTTDSMEFVVARPPDLTAFPAAPASDLRKVYYYLAASLEGTNFVITGLDRTEETLLTKPTATGNSTQITPPGPLAVATNSATVLPLATEIQFVRFRYWDGTGWLEAWDAPELPYAVEVTLGAEALPEDEVPEAYSAEVFRRVILLPGRRSKEDDWWAAL
jgi:prepilin-type N-terminal cleavage/methylation domain-containing protein